MALIWGALVLFQGFSSAATPGGTSIPNIASSSFTNLAGNRTADSNQTAVTVNHVVDINITPSHTEYLQAGKSIALQHTISNNSNIDDTIDMTASSPLGLTVEFFTSDGITPLVDNNGNGNVDTGILATGSSVDITVKITAPESVEPGPADETVITVSSGVDPSVMKSVTDSCTILKAKFWDPLVKSVEPPGQVTPESTLTYTNIFGNAGNIPAENVVITDILDANLIYIEGSATEPPGIQGTIIIYDPVIRTISWTIPSIPPGYTGQISFKARLNPQIPSDSDINNTIQLSSDQTPGAQVSNAAKITVVEQALRITKTANKKIAETGDYVVYTVEVSNVSKSMTAHDVIVIDDLPQGFRYLKNSSTLDSSDFPDPESGLPVRWRIGSLPPESKKTLTYRVIISIDAPLGNGVNTASVTGETLGGNNLFAGPSTSTVKVKEGILNSKGIILGRVFADENGDGMPDENEEGIKGARLYLEDGTYVITDEEGKFSIYGIEAGEHVLKLDPVTVPDGYDPVPVDSSFAGDGGSRFITVPFGGPARGDFALAPENKESISQDKGEEIPKKKKYTFGAEINSAPLPLETQILTMTADAEILEPADKSSLKKAWSDIVIRVPENADYTLEVNGAPVPADKIGKTIHEMERKILIHQYVSVALNAGINRILLECKTAEGVMIRKEIEVYAPGPPEKIVITPDKSDIPADSRTSVPFTVQLLDKWGKPSTDEQVITVITEKGTVLEEDIDPSSPGHQLKAKNGQTKFNLRSTLRTGADVIKILLGSEISASANVYFTQELRDWIIVGIAEMTAGKRDVEGNVEKITATDDFEEGIFRDERIALFLKGKVLGKYLLTAAYDSAKEKREELFQQVNPEKYYPVYGDASETGYEAESQDKLYVKIEKDRSSIMYGDYRTGLTQNEFSRYDRTFNGAKADIDTGRFSLKAFGSRTSQTVTKDELRGNGTSGFYFLSKSPVIENSETVRIEVRDRYHPEKVLSSVDKARYTDYTVNYTGGTILFDEPVPSQDENLNTVHIVITYESDDEGDEFYIYGGRAGVKFANGSELGVTGIVEEQELKDTTLAGADAKIRITARSEIRGEIAVSDTLDKERDEAYKVEMSSEPFDKLRTKMYYRSVGEDFQNPSMSGGETGTDKYGAELDYYLTNRTHILAESFVQNNKISGTELRSNSLGLSREFNRFSAEGGYKYLGEDRTDNNAKESQLVFAGIKGNITDKLDASLRRDQVVSSSEIEDYQTKTAAGLGYKITETTSAYITQEFQEGEENRRDATLAGIESRVTENTTLSSRYQIENSVSGERSQASLGLNNKWEIRKSLTINTAVERIQEIKGENGGDNTALSVSAEYLQEKDFKATGRYEIRLGENETTNLLTLNTGSRLSSSTSLLTNMSFWKSRKNEGNDSLIDALLGLAYRPLGKKSLYMLNTVQLKLNHQGSTATNDRSRSVIFSTEASYKISPRWTLLGKYAGKYTWEDIGGKDFKAYTDLIFAGVNYDITKKWDTGVYSKIMNQYQTKMHSTGYIVRTGYNIAKNMHLGIGYNSSELDDRDLSGGSYKARGMFVDMKIKFDEDSFKSIDKLKHVL